MQVRQRRRAPRHAVALVVTLLSCTDDALATGRVVNLCSRGARVEDLPLDGTFDWTNVPLVPDTLIRIAVHVTDGLEPLVLRSSVQWRRDGAIGVALSRLSPEAELRLTRAMNDASAARPLSLQSMYARSATPEGQRASGPGDPDGEAYPVV